MKKLPIYKIKIKENEELGVDAVAFVDDPAIERTWQTFNRAKQYFTDKERQIVSGPIMVANLPIYRRDEQYGEYYVVFDKETIHSIVERFLKKGFSNNVNLMHDPNKKVEGVSIFNLFIIDKTMGIKTPEGFEDLTDGSAFASYRVTDPKVWEEIKAGTFSGFSVEGLFDHDFVEDKDEITIAEIIEIIQKA
jgi:hypothetical protein